MPAMTLYSKFTKGSFEDLQVKMKTHDTEDRDNRPIAYDWNYTDIADAIACKPGSDTLTQWMELTEESLINGTSIAMDLDEQSRDGTYDIDQLFAVYEVADLEAMIRKLQQCVIAAQFGG